MAKKDRFLTCIAVIEKQVGRLPSVPRHTNHTPVCHRRPELVWANRLQNIWKIYFATLESGVRLSFFVSTHRSEAVEYRCGAEALRSIFTPTFSRLISRKASQI